MPAVLKVPRGTRQAHGFLFPPHADGRPMNDLEIHFICFLRGGTNQTSKYDHCVAAINLLWPKILVHPWMERLLRAFCKNNYTGVTGCANSAKSFTMAIYGLVSWWADPLHTLVFIVSTTKIDAKRRVWAHVQRLHREVALPMPGRMLHSIDSIALRDMKEDEMGTDASAVILVAAGDSSDKALQKLQGAKNDRVILLVDEGQDVTHSIEDAMFNLRNNDVFEFRVVGNPGMTHDFHGRFCEPATPEGHNQDLENVDSWPILALGMYTGEAVHLNAVDSPNFAREAAGLPLLPYLPKPDDVRATRATLGRDDARLWRQSIGCWPLGVGVRQTVFTDPETVKFKMRERVEFASRKRGFGIDPAYTEFGDDFVVYPFDYGATREGKAVLQLEKPIIIPDRPYIEEDGVTYSGPFARAKRVRDLALEHGVPAKYIGMDTTGHNPFKDILSAEMGAEIIGIEFGSSASDELEVSLTDERASEEAYADKATELWYSLRQFAEHDQLRGVDDPDTLRQLTNRKFITRARGKVKLEAKKDYKKRTGGKSPDKADGAAACTEVARAAMGAVAGQEVLEARQAIARQSARIAARVHPPRLGGVKGVGRLQFTR